MLANLKNILIGAFSAIIVVALGASAYTAFASPDGGEPASAAFAPDFGNGVGNENTTGDHAGNRSGTGVSVLDIPASDLSPEEEAALLFMREEEKLARDVYNTLFTIWGQPTFSNIAASEGAHMDEVKLLLDRYNLADPALAPGVFTDPNLQVLYDQLVAQGSISLPDALKVGAAIEEVDILDLEARLAQTDSPDIQQVFNNLKLGSYNHLSSFVNVLSAQAGETYQPQYLSAEAYAAIVTGQSGNGSANGAGTTSGQGGAGNRGRQNDSTTGNSANAPQAQETISGTSTFTGTVNGYDLVTLSVLTPEGETIVVQLGNAQYAQSIGFNPQIGAPVSIAGFPGDQGLFSASSVTVNGQTYTFRDDLGRPLWAGGKGNGRGGNH